MRMFFFDFGLSRQIRPPQFFHSGAQLGIAQSCNAPWQALCQPPCPDTTSRGSWLYYWEQEATRSKEATKQLLVAPGLTLSLFVPEAAAAESSFAGVVRPDASHTMRQRLDDMV